MKLEKLIVLTTLQDLGTGKILLDIKKLLNPNNSRFGFIFEESEEDEEKADLIN